MKILVPVKRVIDPSISVRIKDDGLAVVSENIPHAMNPYDETALGEATTLKTNLPDLEIEIIALSIGPIEAKETLQIALAMGADRAIHILSEQVLESLVIAELLKIMVKETRADLVLMGKQSSDTDNGQIGPMLALLLGWPQACNVSKILLDTQQIPEDGFGCVGPDYARKLLSYKEGERRPILVIREVEQGRDVIGFRLPGLITCDFTPQPGAPRWARRSHQSQTPNH